MIEEGKKNFLSLYTSSLHPLIFNTDISEEDLFNFALYQSLPLDKQKNKVLMISNNGSDQIYEIKSTTYNQDTKNYDSFTKLLEMNPIDKLVADSILNSYKKDIYSYVLVNDKDAYAINPKIVKVQQAMFADLVSVAYRINPKRAEKLFASTKIDHNDLATIIHEAKTPVPPEYLVITPDTVAKADFYWDEHKFDKQLKDYELGKLAASDFSQDKAFKWNPNESRMKNQDKNLRRPLDFKIDPKFSRITIPVNEISKLMNDSLQTAMREVQRKLRSISFRFPGTRRQPGRSVNMIPPVPIQSIMNGTLKVTEEALNMVGKIDFSKIIEEAMKDSAGHKMPSLDSVKMKRMRDRLIEANKKLQKMGLDTLKH